MDLIQRRRVMLAAGKKPRLPREYQEVEYLEATGTQYIDTGLVANNPWRATIGFTFSSLTGTQILSGTYWGDFSGHGRNIIRKESNGYFSVANHSYEIALVSTVRAQQGQLYEIDAEIGQSTQKIAINGEQFTKASSYTTAGGNIFLLALNEYHTGTIGGFCFGKMTHAEYYDKNGSMMREYLLCYRKSDNKPGMYDLCGSICPLTNSPFYINAGTGEFLVGPNVN